MGRAHRTPWIVLAFALAFVLGGLLPACGGAVTTEALSVSPAHLPLRAYPNIIVVPGPLEEDGQVARALTRHLKKAGHTRVQIVEESRLRSHTARRRMPAATLVVELLVATHERVHAQFGQRGRTTCDSLGCFDSNTRNSQDVPVMRATLQITVRDGRSMRVVQRARLRAVQASGNFDNLKRDAVLALIGRLRASTEQLPELVEVELLPVDLPDVQLAIDEAHEGRWPEAITALQRGVASSGFARLPAAERARVHFDLGQAHRALGLAGDPGPIEAALRDYATARALDPGAPIHARLQASARRDLRAARRVRSQRIQAARNFRFAADRAPRGGRKPGTEAGTEQGRGS